MKRLIITAVSLTILPPLAGATEVLTLQQCRDSAAANNKELMIARQKTIMAGYDKNIAMANYFPDVSVSAAYLYNNRNPKLISREMSDMLTSLGDNKIAELLGKLTSTDISGAINAIGTEIDNFFELDMENVFIGTVSLRQPIFMGGKIVNANKIASLAEELSETQYDTIYKDMVLEVDNAYWQTVMIANKQRLAERYNTLLEQMLHDTEILLNEGLATQADLLAVKVKANEAELTLSKATNGLALSKMLLCKLCGMNPYKDIELADEKAESVPVPLPCPISSDNEIFKSRPEIRSLELAGQIYDRKIAIERADMMPKIMLTANYLVTNPNIYHGFENRFAGTFNAGVAINIPIIHGCESRQKVRKAQAEATIARLRMDDAKEIISLQVAQLRKQEEEAAEKLKMAGGNLESAEENLRTATIGYNEGVIPANTVLAAQTAWVKARSEWIEAGIELQITNGKLSAAISGK